MSDVHPEQVAAAARNLNRKHKNALRYSIEDDFDPIKVGHSALKQIVAMGLLIERETAPNTYSMQVSPLGMAVYRYLEMRRDL